MHFSEALELLKAARPLIDKIRYTKFDWATSFQEYEALRDIEEVLQQFNYSKDLLKQAGWNQLDLSFLHGRLQHYRTHLPKSLISKLS